MQTAFGDLTPNKFPFQIEFINVLGRVVWSAMVEGPGALYIPPVAKDHGPVATRITYANGEVDEYAAPLRRAS